MGVKDDVMYKLFRTVMERAIEGMADDPDLETKIRKYTQDYRGQVAGAGQQGNVTTPTAEQSKEQLEAARKKSDDKGTENKSRAEKYKKTTGQWAAELIPSVVGNVLEGLGSISQAKGAILANALMGATESAMPSRAAEVYGNPYKAAGVVASTPHMLRGAVLGGLGSMAGNIGRDIARRTTTENERYRNTRMLLDEELPPSNRRVSGNFFENQRLQGKQEY